MFRFLPFFAFCCLGLGCSPAPVHATLDSAGGLGPGSRVYAAGVAIGSVESVVVDGVQADVAFTLQAGHSLSLRADACAMSLSEGKGALLLLIPGKAMERLAPRPVPGCELEEQRLTMLKQLAASGGGVLSHAIHRYLEAMGEVPVPVADGVGPACGALTVSRLRIEQVDAVPLLLPAGGRRLWLSVENRGGSPVSLETATFLDARGAVATQARVPEKADLFLSVSIPGHTRREVSAVFAGSRANQVSAVEMEASFLDAAPGAACRVRWSL